MRLKVLGTQSPYNTAGHNCPGFLISDKTSKILLDCGSGSHSLLAFPDDLKNLSVIISHLHRDHYNDIFNLLYASYVFKNQGDLEKPIDIYLPRNPKKNYLDVIEEEIGFANYYSYNEYTIYWIGNFWVSFCKTAHPIDTYAVKIKKGKKTIVYTADTSFACADRLIEFAKGADILICESSLLESYHSNAESVHLTAKQAGLIAKNANVKRLLLTHLWPEELPDNYLNEARDVFLNAYIAQEGDIIVI